MNCSEWVQTIVDLEHALLGISVFIVFVSYALKITKKILGRA